MNDWALALAGVLLGVGSSVGWAACSWHRDRIPYGQRQLIRRVFIHCDDLLGATKTENQVRAGKRFNAQRPIWRGGLGRKLGKAWADTWWPVQQFGGTSARPNVTRMGQYVRLTFARPKRVGRPYRIWDIDSVTLSWTSEATPLVGHFAENVGRKVAQALRLAGPDQLEWTVDYDAGLVTYTRKGPAPERPTHVPVGVNADA